MKVTYTEEAVADIVQAITYLNERSPAAAAKLDAEIARCIDRLVRTGSDRQTSTAGRKSTPGASHT